MQARIPLTSEKLEAVFRAMWALKDPVRDAGLELSLLHLIKLRVSQINGCGYCIDMHAKDARAHGETEQRLYLVQVWRETSLYNERECAALALAEAMTNVSSGPVPDAVYDAARAAFSESELTALALAIVEINGWNRISITFNVVPGTYRVGQHG